MPHPSEMPTLDEDIAQAQWYADNDQYIMIVSKMLGVVVIGVADKDEKTVVDGAILEASEE